MKPDCDNPVSLTPSSVVDQEYTIQDVALLYTFDEFTSDPYGCPITYTYTIVDSSGAAALTSFDPLARSFTI